MSSEKLIPDPPKNPTTTILAYVAVAVVAFGLGWLVESQMAGRTAAEARTVHDKEMKQAADKAEQAQAKAEQEMQALNESLAKERESHEKDIQAKDKSLAAAANRAAGVRHGLEADLSAARASGDACTGRIARISEALDGVFASIGEVTGIAQDLGRENEQLKADNKSLSEKLAGWQKWNADRQRVTVVGQKKG